MTPAMGAIYDAITDLMDACLKELRRSNKVLAADRLVAYGDRAVIAMSLGRKSADDIWTGGVLC